MNFGEFDLNLFEVDCDGSGCGSHTGEIYVHPAEGLIKGEALGRVAIRSGRVLWDSLVPAGEPVKVQ